MPLIASPENILDNEDQAGLLVNATSAGDAGGRADHFNLGTLSSAWTVEEGTGRTTTGNSVLAVKTTPSHITMPFTPSGAFRVEARMQLRMDASGATSAAIGVRDSGTGDTGSGWAICLLPPAAGCGPIDMTGTTLSGSTNFVCVLGTWYWFAIQRDGSNNWKFYVSTDRWDWVDLTGTGAAANLTVAKLIIRAKNVASIDAFDVVS